MNLQDLTELAHAGTIDELELLSLEGGFYVLRALSGAGPQTLCDARGQALHLRSITELRQLLADVPPLRCMLVQQVVHDEMCGQRDGPIEPLRVPVSLAIQW
ncbi:hypothetical protein SAMN05216598_4405 [Pseudomonas asplenii]|uniref:Metal ABC transporter ATPase n=1 Tax=Pseudomonas asplenii TaxID=53407 RepID=A0A1H1YGB2_9PSED|nr:DUF6482 family protein [Pseudomonas asplenii]SDT20319.1 hypothetical protein SAMN05216598_4405 [Pseudomonas asplenii]